MVTTEKELKSFRLHVDTLLSDTDIKSKKQLAFLMKQRGFRVARDNTRLYPSEKQLEIAWHHLSSKSNIVNVPAMQFITVKGYSYIRNGKTVYIKTYKRKRRKK